MRTLIGNHSKLLIVRSIYPLLEKGDSGVTLLAQVWGFTQSSEGVYGTQPCFLDCRGGSGLAEGVTGSVTHFIKSTHPESRGLLYNSSFTRGFIENLINT